MGPETPIPGAPITPQLHAKLGSMGKRIVDMEKAHIECRTDLCGLSGKNGRIGRLEAGQSDLSKECAATRKLVWKFAIAVLGASTAGAGLGHAVVTALTGG